MRVRVIKGVGIGSTYPSRFFGFGFWLWLKFWQKIFRKGLLFGFSM
jgi:hypothetical protein